MYFKLEETIDKISNFIEKKEIKELQEYLNKTIKSEDIPSILEYLDEDKSIMIYRLLNKEKATQVFVEMDHNEQEKLISMLTDNEIENVMNEIYMDDATDLIEEMPSNVVKRILSNTKLENRNIINELLKYPAETAGTIMTTEYIDLKETMTVENAFYYIKQKELKKETVYNCYVVTNERKLVGVVDIKELLVAERDKLIKDIMDTNVLKTNTLEDQEEVSRMFYKYNCIALPVVDNENRLVGIITIDDVMEVINEETSEDFEKMSALTPNDGEAYLKTSVFKHARHRILWLLLLMVSAMITGSVIEHYEAAISSLPLLVSFIPMIMDTGGNCGSQASTLIIRGLAMNEIHPKDIFKAMWKEFRISIIVGLVLAFVNSIRIMIQYQNIQIAIAVSATLVITVMMAKLLGCILPIVAKKLKLDPAIMAAPLITTIVDTLSVLVFFNISTLIFHI